MPEKVSQPAEPRTCVAPFFLSPELGFRQSKCRKSTPLSLYWPRCQSHFFVGTLGNGGGVEGNCNLSPAWWSHSGRVWAPFASFTRISRRGGGGSSLSAGRPRARTSDWAA